MLETFTGLIGEIRYEEYRLCVSLLCGYLQELVEEEKRIAALESKINKLGG